MQYNYALIEENLRKIGTLETIENVAFNLIKNNNALPLNYPRLDFTNYKNQNLYIQIQSIKANLRKIIVITLIDAIKSKIEIAITIVSQATLYKTII